MIGDFKMIGLCITLALTLVGFLIGWFCTKPIHGVHTFQTRVGAGVLLGSLVFLVSGAISWLILIFKSVS